MLTHLPLLYQAAFTLVHKLHRIFERHNMAVSVMVEKIHHRRERRGFSATGRTRHQNQPAVTGEQFRDSSGHTQCRKLRARERQQSQGDRHSLHMRKRTAAKTLIACERDGKVYLSVCPPRALLFIVEPGF